MNKYLFFRERLLEWFAQNHRPLPWKGELDPYKIWLSEIILQQTRVEQGLPYYHKFVEKYPTVRHLAEADEDEVLKLWEGLGYYSRARNLLHTAKFIVENLGGKFPETYLGIRALKGVGDYTAAAIASFAFNLPHAVLDGNVYRVLARYFGIETPIETSDAKKQFSFLAQELLEATRPGEFNQALMDFGATHCTPKQPKCSSCPLRPHCEAYAQNKVASLPVKSKNLTKKARYFAYLVANFRGDTFVRKRIKKDIWQNLWEFPALELPEFPKDNWELGEAIHNVFHTGTRGWPAIKYSKPYRQTLTHRFVTAVFCEINFSDDTSLEVFEKQPFDECLRVKKSDMKKNIAFPRIIDQYLEETALTLSLF